MMHFFGYIGFTLAISFVFSGCYVPSAKPGEKGEWRVDGVDAEGYDALGFKDGRDRQGFDTHGCNKDGEDRFGLLCSDLKEFVDKKVTAKVYTDLQDLVDTQRDDIDDVTAERDQIQSQFDQAEADVSARDNQLGQANRTILARDESIARLEQQREQLTTSLDEARTERADLQTRVDALTQQAVIDRATIHDREQARLTALNLVQTTTQEVEDMRRLRMADTQENQRLTDENARVRQETSDLEERVRNSEQQIRQLNNTITAHEQTIRDEQEATRKRSEEFSELQKELEKREGEFREALLEEKEKYTAQIERLQSEHLAALEEKDEELQTLARENKATQKQLVRAHKQKEKSSTQEIERLTRKTALHEENLSKLQKRSEEAERNVELLTEENADLDRELQDMRHEIATKGALEESNLELSEQLRTQGVELESVKNKFAEIAQENQDLLSGVQEAIDVWNEADFSCINDLFKAEFKLTPKTLGFFVATLADEYRALAERPMATTSIDPPTTPIISRTKQRKDPSTPTQVNAFSVTGSADTNPEGHRSEQDSDDGFF